MLAEYNGKWFNPVHVSGITHHKNYHTGLTQTVKIYAVMVSGSIHEVASMKLENNDSAQEYIEKMYNELALFINKHCKGK